MTRIGVSAFLLFASPAFAQHRGGGAMHAPTHGPTHGAAHGPTHVGPQQGGYHMIQGSGTYRPPITGVPFSSGVPRYGLSGGIGYGGLGVGGLGYGGLGYGSGFYSYGVPSAAPRVSYYTPPSLVLPPAPSAATVLSGQSPATLTVQFPAAARIWVDGVEVPGDPDTDWTLTSKVLRPGETATFKVRGRWTQDGKTLEATREVALGPGARSRLVVVSGNAVEE